MRLYTALAGSLMLVGASLLSATLRNSVTDFADGRILGFQAIIALGAGARLQSWL